MIFDTLQLGADWTEDAIGYNFRHRLPSQTLATPGHLYFVQYSLLGWDGFTAQINFEVAVRGVPVRCE